MVDTFNFMPTEKTKEHSESEGSKVTVLLFINTILLALIFPVTGFGVHRIVSEMDRTTAKVEKTNEDLVVVKERQGRILNEVLPAMQKEASDLKKQLEEHMVRTQGRTNP